jgi:hypothetical protein
MLASRELPSVRNSAFLFSVYSEEVRGIGVVVTADHTLIAGSVWNGAGDSTGRE